MKVLVTGGTGYVGSELREHLKGLGHDVRLLVRRESEHKIVGNSFEIVEGDIFNTNACLRACDGCDGVIHLVGIIREYPEKGITFDELHRVATENIVDAAKRMNVPRFMHMSALGARENARSTYHRSKFAAEEIVRHSGLRWTIFRPAWTFARGDELFQRFLYLIQKPVIPLIDGGSALMQPIALSDVVRCFGLSLVMPETQGKTYELAGPDRISFHDIIQKIASYLGRGIRTISVPAWSIFPIVRAMQRFGGFPVTIDQIRMLTEDNICEIDPYVKTFRLEPRSFVQSLPQLLG